MFEKRDNDDIKSYSLSFFSKIPWIVRAYLYLLIVFFIALIVMGVVDVLAEKPVFTAAMDRILSFLGLVVGAVLGALSVSLKKDRSFPDKP